MKKNTEYNNSLRNVAIIAHVDHGKTTLVDAMFKQSGLFREGQEVDDRLMDSMDLERERGITIAAKNCSVTWHGVKINIIDTPGHADFGGEVERALSMSDSAILLVDASEGPLPQTRFVLKKTFEAKLPVMVIINKIDRKDARPDEVLDMVYDLFIDLDATEEQLDFTYLYAIGRDGIVKKELDEDVDNLTILFDLIVEKMPAPSYDSEAPFQMLVSDLGYSDYLGRLAIGKIFNGSAKFNENLVCIGENNKLLPLKVSKLQTYDGTVLLPVEQAQVGDIIVLSGIEDVKIGDTICTKKEPVPLERITVDEPTVFMRFSISTSPFAGREGKYVQSRKIRERLLKETLMNVAIEVEESSTDESFTVKGRGELQLAILIETMRREGFELCVGRPRVIYKYNSEGNRLEPIEHLFVDCEEAFLGVVTEKLSIRKGKMINLVNNGKGRVRIEFSIPSRSLIGYRDEFMTDTRGTGIVNSYLSGYEAHRGDFPIRYNGSIVSDRQGRAVPYALFNLEPRGQLLVEPGTPLYEGMIVGEHNRHQDIEVNACKEKKLTNMRASGKDESVICSPIKVMTLEKAIHFIGDDEMVEVTPLSIRLRKTVLKASQRQVLKAKQNKKDKK
ncbi:translational GTPase TypA [Desulfobacula sp.]